jgi:rhodanese-related sulfurtransferase
MDFVTILVIAIFVVFLVQRFLPIKGVRSITTTQLKEEMKNTKNKQFIDVRTPGEFRARNSKSFKNIPLYDLSKNSTILSKDKEVFIICQSGMRSMKAAKVLKKLGFKQITNVKGGMNAW